MSDYRELVERLRDFTDLVVQSGIFTDELVGDEAAAAIERLLAERDEARNKADRQATEIQRMARKIKNQRKMASDTWVIVENRAHWTRGILNRNKYLHMAVEAMAGRRAAEAERDRARQALEDKP